MKLLSALGCILLSVTLSAQTADPKTSAEADARHLQIKSDLANTRAELEKNPLFIHWLALQGELATNEFVRGNLAQAESAAKRKVARDAMDKANEDKKRAVFAPQVIPPNPPK